MGTHLAAFTYNNQQRKTRLKRAAMAFESTIHTRLISRLAIGAVLMAVMAFALVAPTAFADEQTAPLTAEDGALLMAEDDAPLTPQNGVPLVIVRVNEAEGGSIDAMNNSYQHKQKCTSATVEILLPEDYSGGYAPAGTASVPEGEMTLDYIRGRGNSTWNSSKKPYKLQLSGKQDLFGMGASEDWALMANSYDQTLMRNQITFWLGEQMGLEFTPRQVPVDLVMIGSESGVHRYGSYCLCETVKVEDSRVAIDKLKKNDAENVTGGYILATYSDQGKDIPESTVFITNHGVEFANDSPEYESENLTEAQQLQRAYIRDYMQELDDLIMAPGDIDAARHEEIANMMDLTSLADYWLLQEISFNTDGFATTSTYLYKKRDGKLYWGPLWDFDNAWNNNGMWSDANRTFNNTAMLWVDQLRDKDPQFVSLLQERWSLLNEKLEELTRPGGVIDQYAAEVGASQRADYEIWKDAAGGDYHGTSQEDYDTAVDELKSWIDDRREWAESNKADIGKVYYTVSYEAHGQVVATEQVRYDRYATMDPDAPAPEGKVFSCWKKGNKTPDKVAIVEDTVFTAEYVDESEAVAPESLIIDVPEEMTTVQLDSEFFPATSNSFDDPHSLDDFVFIEPYDATNQRVRWTSSDEAVASIDEVNHRVVLNGGGDVIITGTLYNGISDSFTLHVQGEPAKYTVRFVDDDGTELQSTKTPRGETPQYTGATPVKAETEQYSYAFSGWTPTIVPVTGNAEYRATYAATEKPGVYTVVSGSDATWTKGSGQTADFTFKRSFNDDETFERFVGLEVDGEAVAEKDASGNANYTIERGSVIVNLNPAYLETLSIGKHEFRAVFDDAVSEGALLDVTEAPEPDDGGGDGDKPDDGKADGSGSKDASGNSDASGKAASTSKSSSPLSKTGDAIPIAALCILAIAGAAIAFAAHRRLDETR